MELVSYNATVFTSLGVTAPKFNDPGSPGVDRQVQATPRLSADPMPGGVMTGVQTLVAEFTPAQGQDTESTLMKVIAALDLDDPYPKTLTGKLLNGTTITTQAKVGQYSYRGVNTLLVPFVLTEAWSGTGVTTLRVLSPASANGSFASTNQTGNRDMLPSVLVTWDGVTQRSSSTAALGWKHRLGSGLTLTNIGTEPLINQPYQIGPINHAALVTAGQALSSGNDFRVFCEGVELRRNLIGPNTAAMFAWVVLPTVAPGQAITLDLLTNNPSAGSPPTLTFSSDPSLPGMDISGTSFTGATGSGGFTITKAGAGWETNQWAGGTLITGSSVAARDKLMRRIVSNTATVLTLDEIITGSITAADTITIIKSGLRGTGGYVWTPTSTTIDLSPNTFNPNEWAGGTLEVLTGAGAGQRRAIVSNTTTTFVVTPAFTTVPASPDAIRVYQSNGQRMWDVRTPPKTTSYPGLWQANKIQAPPTQVRFDAPGSWYRFTYLPNQDEYSQPRYDSFLVGAGDYDHAPVMNIQRARRGKVGTQREVGIADAIGVSSPFPITGARFGYTLRNAKKAGVAEGMAEARFMTQAAGGELWSTFLSDVAVRNSTATIAPAWYDLTAYGSANRLAMTLVPNASDEIPSADNNTAQLRSSGDYVSVAVNPQSVLTESIDWIASPPATVAVYDVSLLVRRGGASATPPYHQLVIGGPDHRIFISALTQRILVDCAMRRVTLVDGSGIFLRDIPWCVQAQEVVTDPDGVNRTLVAARWLPIPPVSVDSNNTYYTDPSGAGWGQIGLSVYGGLGFRT